MRPVAELIPYARNSRVHSEQQVSQIAASIKEWGWTVPVLVDDDGVIIAGHCRVMAAQKLGIESVPCMVASGWSDAQKRAYVIADNRLTEIAVWDDAILDGDGRTFSEIKAERIGCAEKVSSSAA
jgi:ParB-like chromosome segregation protein Spo0J